MRTPEQLVANAAALKQAHGFTSHKLKGGVYPPAHELACYRALAQSLPGERFRYDPNSALSLADAIEFGRDILDIRNDYFEDPVWGMPQLKRLKDFVPLPIATNTVVVNFEQLATNIQIGAVDVILLDTTFWGGIRPCIKAAASARRWASGVAVHSSGELGIQLATMLHMGAVVPNLGYAADAHYHHLTDDVIVGGPMRYRERAPSACRTRPGSAIHLDRDKLAQLSRALPRARRLPLRSRPRAPGLVRARSQRTLRRSERVAATALVLISRVRSD